MSATTFVLGGVVHPLVQVSVWCWQWSAVDARFGLLQCVFHSRKKGKEGGGTKCSSVPKTPHTPQCLHGSCAGMSGISVLLHHVEWMVVFSLYLGTFGPLYDSGCVLTEEVETWGGDCWVVMSACICLSLWAQNECVLWRSQTTDSLLTDAAPCLYSHFLPSSK